MLASGSVASTAGAMVSAWGRGADSSAVSAESSSATIALGSSPSQDKSVNFLHSTQLVVNQVRLPIYMYYSAKIYTYKLDRTTVTVGAPSMLAMSTSPASARPLLRLQLPLALQQGLRLAPSCPQQLAPAARLLSRWGLGCGFFQPVPPPSPSRLRPIGLWGRKVESPAINEFLSSAYTTLKDKYLTTLLEEFTS
jgi:hypothetical protein